MIPIEFLLFGATLLGVAVFHRHTLSVALLGLAAITAYKVLFGDFYGAPGAVGLLFHLHAEWVILANLFALLVGFALLSRHFEQSNLPHLLPRILPDDWKGGLVLLVLVFVISGFLDNIAAAMIGATVARTVFRGNVHLGFLAAIVVALVLVAAIGANVYANNLPEGRTGVFPYIGATVAGVLLLLTPWRRPDWSIVPEAAKGSVFLLALVLSASMMPVHELPGASPQTTFGLGFVSAVFDNIPLTKLALQQGGYDWAALAFAVGFGGSMIWFGSSAGVAVSNLFPEAKSVGHWLREGWYVAVGYVVGFFILMLVVGWHPQESHRTF